MNITHGLRRALQINPLGIAVLEGERKWTWAEVGERVSRLAGALRQRGVSKGDRVAVLMLNGGRYLELYLAVGWAGAVIVPLNIRWSVAENRDVLQDCGAGMLIVDNAFMEAGRALAATIPALTLVHADEGEPPTDVAGYESLLAAANPIPDAIAGRDDLSGIFYTGGTTGRSKGVMLSHGNLMANALQALAEGLHSPNPIYLHAAPMFHLANGGAMYCMLLTASTNAIIKAFSPEAVAQAIERFRVTDVMLVPTMIQMFVDHPGIAGRDLLVTADRVRRLPDLRGAARPRHGASARCALHPGLRHDRALPGGDHAVGGGARRRRPGQRPASLRRTSNAWCRGEDR
jgi:long-chain acyl-CoA synthetase